MSNENTKIALQLKEHKNVQGLMQYINKENLLIQHLKQDKNKAIGVDKVTKTEYEKDIQNNLENLVKRMKKFEYRPQPVRRTYIPKIGSEKLRPLGIPAYEDKLVQGVMTDLLNDVYENIFCKTSYGFRPDKNCHMAIKELDNIIMRKRVNYIVDADIKGFFDNVDHEWLIKFLEHEIKDKNFIRYIRRFLSSGIMNNGQFYDSEKGTPQGGLVSPILANIYLHYVLDLWFELDIKVRYKKEAYIVRYADDFVCCFEEEEEAKQFYVELKERLAKFNLELAEYKTKIIKFGKKSKRSQ